MLFSGKNLKNIISTTADKSLIYYLNIKYKAYIDTAHPYFF